MSILTIADAIAQCRLPDDYPPEQLQPYMDAADEAATAYLNRAVYADAGALAGAQDSTPQAVADAYHAFSDALAAANAMGDPNQSQAAIAVAQARLNDATQAADRTVRGIVANAAIVAAVRLLMAHLFANREDVMTGQRAQAIAIPNGARDLLRPYRWGMTP